MVPCGFKMLSPTHLYGHFSAQSKPQNLKEGPLQCNWSQVWEPWGSFFVGYRAESAKETSTIHEKKKYKKNPNTFEFLQNSNTYYTNLQNISVFCSEKKCGNWRQFESNPLCKVLRYEVAATRWYVDQHRSPPNHFWRSCLFFPSQFAIINKTRPLL